MVCTNCGTEVGMDKKFCPNCGTKINNVNPINPASANNSYVPNRNFKTSKPVVKNKGKKGLLIGVCIGIGVLLVAAIICVIVLINANKAVSVKFNLNVKDYSDVTCTKIPVEVSGSDDYKNTFFINSNGDGAELRPGKYTIRYIASPLREDGKFYSVPKDTRDFEVRSNGNNEMFFDNFGIGFADITTVSDSDINYAATVAKQCEDQANKVDNYANATIKAKNNALAAKKEQEAVTAKSNKVNDFHIRNDAIYKKNQSMIDGIPDKDWTAGKARDVQYEVTQNYEPLIKDINSYASQNCSASIAAQVKSLLDIDDGKHQEFIELSNHNDTEGIDKYYHDTIQKAINLLNKS